MADQHEAGEIKAAGAVLWRAAGRGVQVALVHRPKYDDWSFAKGKLNPGEHVLLAAVREVEEETGLQVTLGRNLPPVRYPTEGGPKRVDYWAAQAHRAAAGFVPNSEVDRIDWVVATAAGDRLSYGHDAQLLADFGAGPRLTVPLILVRHGSAGSKSDWRKGDDSRPLDGRGRQQAKMLARLLRCFGPATVLCSPAERCVATVRPFAAATGTEVVAVPAFAVPGTSRKRRAPDGAQEETAGLAAAAAAAQGSAVVICAHRENLPLLLRAACAQLGAEPPDGPPLRKGEFWVLHRAAGALAGAERHHPDHDEQRLPTSAGRGWHEAPATASAGP
jgi:8-oxo-(d)GTP phosphatase